MGGKSRIQNSEFRKRHAAQRPSSFILHPSSFPRRPAFTLTELMIVISIMAILAGLGAAAMTGATNLAREHRAGTMITKIDQLIMERYEGYRTRTVPVKIPMNVYWLPTGSVNSGGGRIAAMFRLNAIRDLMRMELPDRKSDVIDPPCDCDPRPGNDSFNNPYAYYMPQPALQKAYQRLAIRQTQSQPPTLATLATKWTEQNQGSECLYLILSTMRDGDKQALDYFDATEIGDTDGDGMNEILDGWGTPIEFVRWPAGYAENPGPDGQWGRAGVDDDGDNVIDNISEAGWPGSDDSIALQNTLITTPRTVQTKNYLRAPDPFDPVKVHAVDPINPASPAFTLFATNYTPGYNLHPLIVSAGPDKKFDIVRDLVDPAIVPTGPFYHYASQVQINNSWTTLNPFVAIQVQLGPAAAQLTIPIGTVGDVDGDGYPGYADNITNHDRASEQ
jgi:prepilin-type N-terminal cleavage/methylation domain-containing protein